MWGQGWAYFSGGNFGTLSTGTATFHGSRLKGITADIQHFTADQAKEATMDW